MHRGLVDALCLKAPWERPLPVFSTSPQPFYPKPSGSRTVPTRLETSARGYPAEGGLTVLTLGYLGRGLQGAIILPDTGQTTDAAAARLALEDLARWAKRTVTARRSVTLYLPKSRLEGGTLARTVALQPLASAAPSTCPAAAPISTVSLPSGPTTTSLAPRCFTRPWSPSKKPAPRPSLQPLWSSPEPPASWFRPSRPPSSVLSARFSPPPTPRQRRLALSRPRHHPPVTRSRKSTPEIELEPPRPLCVVIRIAMSRSALCFCPTTRRVATPRRSWRGC